MYLIQVYTHVLHRMSGDRLAGQRRCRLWVSEFKEGDGLDGHFLSKFLQKKNNKNLVRILKESKN